MLTSEVYIMAILKRDIFDVWVDGELTELQKVKLMDFLAESGKRFTTSINGTTVFDVKSVTSAEAIEHFLLKLIDGDR